MLELPASARHIHVMVAAAAMLVGALMHDAPAAARPPHNCGLVQLGQGPRNDPYLNIPTIKARNMTCQAARAAIHAGTLSIHGCFGQPGRCYVTFRARHFRCKGMDPVECRSGRRMFEFWWGE